jgi:hypothetical protein
MPSNPHNSVVLETKAHLGLNLGLGSASLVTKDKFRILMDVVIIDPSHIDMM